LLFFEAFSSAGDSRELLYPEVAQGTPFEMAVRGASIGRLRPKIMTAATAILGLLPILALRLHGTEIERPLAIVMTGALITSTVFTVLALPTFYVSIHKLGKTRRGDAPTPCSSQNARFSMTKAANSHQG
jgi:Cu/Ag efflux pump CusA